MSEQQMPDGMPTSADERHLRRLLAERVALRGAYYDDGEASGEEHGIVIDFMREPVSDIDAKLRALNVARYIDKKQQAAQIEQQAAEIERLRGVLRYVLDDEPNFLPRASSSCRRVVSAALAEGK